MIKTVHEVSLVHDLLEIAEARAREAEARAIRSLTVEVGAFSCVVPEALEFAFGACSRGTLAEGAGLIITRVSGHGYCSVCLSESSAMTLTAVCPSCGESSFVIDRGTELRLVEMEVD